VPEEEKATGRKAPRDPREHGLGGFGAEVHEHVPAEHDVECARLKDTQTLLDEVPLLESDHRANARIELEIATGGEPPSSRVRRRLAQRPLRVAAARRLFEHV